MIITGTEKETSLVFYNNMYEETLDILLDAQSYFETEGMLVQQQNDPVENLIFAAEMSRIGLRLSSVMAWLMGRRSECTGEISRDEANKRFRLEFSDICTQVLREKDYLLPEYMCQLLDQSLSLYLRALRLDEMISGMPAPTSAQGTNGLPLFH